MNELESRLNTNAFLGKGWSFPPTLTFIHQLAKVRVKLEGMAKDLANATVGVFGYAACTHTKGTVTGTGQKSYLAMHKTT